MSSQFFASYKYAKYLEDLFNGLAFTIALSVPSLIDGNNSEFLFLLLLMTISSDLPPLPYKKVCPENVCLSGKCPEYCNILDIFRTFDPNPYVQNIAIFRTFSG
jgi:hypothetical protein